MVTFGVLEEACASLHFPSLVAGCDSGDLTSRLELDITKIGEQTLLNSLLKGSYKVGIR